MVTDVDIAKRILIKDFDHFVDRTQFGLKLDENNEYDAVRIYHGILLNYARICKRRGILFQISILLFSTWREYFYSQPTNFYSQPTK